MSTLDLTSFIPQAIRTESRIDTVLANRDFLEAALYMHICTGNILDQIKKNVFYNKSFNKEKLNDNIIGLLGSVCILNDSSELTMNSSNFVTDVDLNKELIAVDTRLLHAILGFATESTELIEQLFKVVQTGKDFDRVNLREELGDMFWYSAVMMDTLGANPPDVLQLVVDKLRARFPDKFTSEAAINRDLVKEREILEGKKDV